MIQKALSADEIEFSVAGITIKGSFYKQSVPKALLILIHGMGEHHRRYERSLIPFFLKNDIAVIAYDQIGHGRSEGKKGWHPGYHFLLDCIDLCIDTGNKELGKLPMFVYGHSMGGNVALTYALERPDRLTGVIASSPFIELSFQPPAWKLILGKLLGRFLPKLTLSNELNTSDLSKIEDEVRAYEEDTLIHDQISPSYSITMIEQGGYLLKNASSLKIPLLLLHGTEDKITSSVASQKFSHSTDKAELVLIRGGYHEIHNDLEAPVLYKTLEDWIERQITNP